MKTEEVKRYMVKSAYDLFNLSYTSNTLDSAYVRIMWFLTGLVDMHYKETRDTTECQYDDYELIEFKWRIMKVIDRKIEEALRDEET